MSLVSGSLWTSAQVNTWFLLLVFLSTFTGALLLTQQKKVKMGAFVSPFCELRMPPLNHRQLSELLSVVSQQRPGDLWRDMDTSPTHHC